MLEMFRDALLVDIQEKRQQVAYWKSIPTEIWTRIFQIYVIDVEEEHIDMLTGHPPFAVLRLGMVCHFWREIVHDLPSLWIYVPIPGDSVYGNVTEEIIALYHERAKFQPMIGYSYSAPTAYLQRLDRLPCFRDREYVGYSRFHLRPEHYVSVLDREEHALRPVGRLSWRPTTVFAFEITDLHILSDNDDIFAINDEDLSIISSISCVNVTLARQRHAILNSIVANSIVKKVSYNCKRFMTSTPFGFVASLPSASHLELRFSPGWEVLTPARQITLLFITTLTSTTNILERIFESRVSLPALRHVELLVETLDTLIVGQWKYFLSIHERELQITHLTLNELSCPITPSAIKACAHLVLALPNLTHLDLYGELAGTTLSGLEHKVIPNSLGHLTVHESTITAERMANAVMACQFRDLELNFDQCAMIDPIAETFIRTLLK
jgi:hypothetical protein